MRKTLWLWIVLAACISACEPNFDEIRDTDQRSVTFEVDVSNMFANVLVPEGDGFVLGDNSGLDDRYRVRITARCYDLAGQLVDRVTLFTTLDARPEIRIRHLDKNQEYQFVFLADVVEFYSEDNFYETWYQLNDKTIENFYITAFERVDTAKYNVILNKILELYPDNQRVEITMDPLSYNGFFLFTNSEGVEALSGNYGYYESLSVLTSSGISRDTIHYELPLTDPTKMAIPLTASYADDVVSLRIRKRTSAGNATILRTLSNPSRKPFVATVDCGSMNIVNYVFY